MTDQDVAMDVQEAMHMASDMSPKAKHAFVADAVRRLVIAELLAGAGVDKDALQAAMARAYDGSGCGQCSIGGIHAAYWAVAPILARLVAERDEWKRRFELAKSDLIDCGEWREDPPQPPRDQYRRNKGSVP